MKTNAQIFAERGDLWNCRAEQEQHSTGQTVRICRAPDGRLLDVEVEWMVEGFDLPFETYQAPVPAPVQAQELNPWSRRACNELRTPARPWNPEYRRVKDEMPGRHPEAQPVKLSQEQLALREKQRAEVQARLQAGAAAMKAKKAERDQAFAALIAKIKGE